MTSDPAVYGTPWTREEVAAAVASYMQMLTLHLNGQRLDKTAFRNRLLAALPGRTKTAIERKHQNISAAMLDLGCMFLPGYAPLRNYQAILADEVAEQVKRNQAFVAAANDAVVRPAAPVLGIDFDRVEIRPPRVPARSVRESTPRAFGQRTATRDYLLREASNRALGDAGEQFAVDFERHRLRRLGRDDLAERVEHVAKSRGDGLGYDVLSHDAETGMELFVEVKTTAFAAETPFFVTENERRVAVAHASQYRICRVFEFRQRPRLYVVSGRFEDHYVMDPASYRAALG